MDNVCAELDYRVLKTRCVKMVSVKMFVVKECQEQWVRANTVAVKVENVKVWLVGPLTVMLTIVQDVRIQLNVIFKVSKCLKDTYFTIIVK
jgi:hypothetical protein